MIALKVLFRYGGGLRSGFCSVLGKGGFDFLRAYLIVRSDFLKLQRTFYCIFDFYLSIIGAAIFVEFASKYFFLNEITGIVEF